MNAITNQPTEFLIIERTHAGHLNLREILPTQTMAYASIMYWYYQEYNSCWWDFDEDSTSSFSIMTREEYYLKDPDMQPPLGFNKEADACDLANDRAAHRNEDCEEPDCITQII